MLDFGRIIAVRHARREVQADPQVQDAYLGTEAPIGEDAAVTPHDRTRSSCSDVVHAATAASRSCTASTSTVPDAAAVVALLGPNGAGKTHDAAGRVGQDDGRRAGCVHVAGTHVNGAAPDELARAGLCTIPEGRGVFPNLTVEENLRLFSYAGDGCRCARSRERPTRASRGWASAARQLAGTMSGGEQQMLAMSPALVDRPGAAAARRALHGAGAADRRRALRRSSPSSPQDGRRILLVEQFARTALAVADYAAVMTQRPHRDGRPAGRRRDFVNEAYLGGAA